MFDADVFAVSLPRNSRRCGGTPGKAPGEVKGLEAGRSEGAASAEEGETDLFIAGTENRLVAAVAQWLLDGALLYSPLFLHGPSGTGKTFLAHSLAHVREGGIYTTGADFVREVAAAIDTNSLSELRKRYRSANFVVLDDVCDLIERRAAQRELTGMLDALELREVPVLVTSRLPLAEISDFSSGLRSRLCGGLQVSIAAPGIPARVEIFKRLAAAKEWTITDRAVQLLAAQVTGTVPQLQGALLELCAGLAAGQAIDVADVERYLKLRRSRRQVSLATIAKVVAKHFGIKPTKLSGPSRSRQVSLARSMAIYLGRQLTGQSLQSLGKHFGNRDHSTVLYNYRKLERQLERDANLRSTVTLLHSSLMAA